MKNRFFLFGLLTALAISSTLIQAQIMISGNENKIELTSGNPAVVHTAASDSLSILDFSVFPPRVEHLSGITNSVVGPPSNIAISPDGKLALIGNSIRIPTTTSTNFVPESHVHVLDLTIKPPKVIERVATELQPSGISFSPNGKLALVANRGSGTISVLSIQGQTVRVVQTVKVCEPAESVSDVAISPDGKTALASIQKAGHLVWLKIDGTKVTATGRKISVAGQPYRTLITPDGQLGLCGGPGFGNGVDMDALSIVDLTGAWPRTVEYVPLGSVPESIELSPDGRLLAAVVMDGSNLAPDHPQLSKHGKLIILERRGRSFAKIQGIEVGRIPEGVAFTSDGKYIAVQCHPDRQIWIFKVNGRKVTDTGVRIDLPGMPSSLRASMSGKRF